MSAMRPMREGDLMKGYFAQVRRAGFDSGISAGKLSRAMMEVLSQLPREAPPSKDVVVQHLGLLGQMSKIRDINAAWNNAKRQIVRERPEALLPRWEGPAAGVRDGGTTPRAALEHRSAQARRPGRTTRDDAGWASRSADLSLAPRQRT